MALMFGRYKLQFITVIGVITGILISSYLNNHWLVNSGMYSTLSTLTVTAIISVILVTLFSGGQNSDLHKIADTLSKVAKGELGLSTQLDQQNDPVLAKLVDSYNSISQKVSASVKAYGESSNNLAFTASEMSSITERTEKNITRQQMETDQVATAMNEMSSTVEEVARSAMHASDAAEQANDATSKGLGIAKETRQEISLLVEDIEKASSVISKLAEESQNIGVVLDVIKGIAEQTNLLALNAAIEAARAGEQGRGFAVVADEVRTLASKTQTSTSEIEEMISRLQSGVDRSVEVMQSSLEKGRHGETQVESTLDALTDIITAVSNINELNAHIATAAEEQSAVANEINQNITAITQVASMTTKDANDSRRTAEKIAGISINLGQQIKDFDPSANDNKLDLSSAKAAHLNWKTRLRSFLDGEEGLTVEQAVSHKHCNFGKWYYSQGLEKFGDIEAIRAVEKPHEELHTLIRTIIELKEAGKNREAEKAYDKVDAISKQIVGYLDQAEHIVNS